MAERSREPVGGNVAARSRRVVDRSINNYVQMSLSSMCLQWIPYSGDSGMVSRRKTSKAWSFMGQLVRVDPLTNDSDVTKLLHSVVSDLLYCRLCFEEQLSEEHGSLSKVYCTSTTTSSGNHLAHAASKHGLRFDKDPTVRVKMEDEDWPDLQLSVSDEQSVVPDGSGVVRSFDIPDMDFKRDFVMLVCSDLRPPSFIDQPGFRAFCIKHTGLELPSTSTLSTSALNDEFETARTRIVDLLGSCVGGTLMLDGWTDGTPGSLGRCYLAVRFSFVKSWSFEVVTLGVRSVESLSAPTAVLLVRDVAAQFLPHNGRRCVLFNTTPDTKEMRALSTALGHERINCVADAVNGLLTTDSLCRVPAVAHLLTKCRALVVAVHFDACSFDGQRDLDLQTHEFDMFQQMAEVHELLRLDDRSRLPTNDEATGPSMIPTRWAVMLAAVNAVLNNLRAVGEALRRIGRSDLCPSADDVDLLNQLRDFLSPFEQFAPLAAECSPNLSLVPLIRTRIQRQCGCSEDSPADGCRLAMDEVRKLVTASLDDRLPLTDVVRLNVCFDPAVRDVLLQRSECEEILTAAYRKLRDSPLAEHFPRAAVSSSTAPDADDCSSGGGSIAAKRLRLSLLMESSSVAMKAVDGAPSDREAGDEIRRYLTLHDDAPALEFWKRHEATLPILAVMARVYLGVCPGSVPFDRLFSSRGLVINDRLCSLPPYRVSMMAFVHDNCRNELLLPID